VKVKSTLVGVLLAALGSWLAVTNVQKCLTELLSLPPRVQCPAASIGLSIFVVLTLGLSLFAIGTTSWLDEPSIHDAA